MPDDLSRTFEVAEPDAGTRLDRFVSDQLGISRGSAGRLIEAGAVLHRGRRARRGTSLAAADLVEIDGHSLAMGEAAQPDASLPLAVCYEDEHLVVVAKPAGMPSHPLRPGEKGTLASALVGHYPEMAGIGRSEREPGLIHRLDIDTSGLLIAARRPDAYAKLTHALASGAIDKQYEALALGQARPGSHAGHLSAQGPTVRMRASPSPGAKLVRTDVLASESCGDHSRVRIQVHTAARHQIRAHMAHIGHPLYGDTRYGGRSAHDGRGHALHAVALAFEHPSGGGRVEVWAPAPERFESCARLLSGRA